MSKKLVVIIIVLVIAAVVLASGIYFLSVSLRDKDGTQVNKLNLPVYMLDVYPNYFDGTINLSGSAAIFNRGDKTYKLQPATPNFYTGEGFEDGQRVEIQGKIVKDEYIIVGEIR